MKDRLCIIDPNHIMNDKIYSNLAEFCLRHPAALEHLAVLGADERIRGGNCSDLDLLREFIALTVQNRDCESKVARSFFKVIDRLLNVSDQMVINGMITADELWSLGYKALANEENSLYGWIKRSGLAELGVAVKNDNVVLPKAIGETAIEPIVCPIPQWSELSKVGDTLRDVEDQIERVVAWKRSGAIFLNEFEFEEPNLYCAEKAFEKLINGTTLKDKERGMLKSQLLRSTVFSSAENGSELMLFLPKSPDLDVLYHIKRFFDYIDESKVPFTKLVLFAPDIVGYSYAVSEMATRRKKITVEAAISGNDCGFVHDDEIKYWGGAMPRYRASLAHTAAGLI